jgi:hypothetical protein
MKCDLTRSSCARTFSRFSRIKPRGEGVNLFQNLLRTRTEGDTPNIGTLLRFIPANLNALLSELLLFEVHGSRRKTYRFQLLAVHKRLLRPHIQLHVPRRLTDHSRHVGVSEPVNTTTSHNARGGC